MNSRRSQQEQPPRKISPSEVFDRLGLLESSGVEDVLLKYNELPAISNVDQITPIHHLHHIATQIVLANDLRAYYKGVTNVHTAEVFSLRQMEYVENKFDDAVQGAKLLRFIEPVLQRISFNLIDWSMSVDNRDSDIFHNAALKLGFAVGDDRILDAKIDRVGENTRSAIINLSKGVRDDAELARASFGIKVLKDYNKVASIIVTPPIARSLLEYAKTHKPRVAAVGTAAMLAVTIITPSAAAASESTASKQYVSAATVIGGDIGLDITSSAESTSTAPNVNGAVKSPDVKQFISVDVGTGIAADSKSNVSKPITLIQAPIPGPEASISVAPSANQVVDSVPKITIVGPEVNTNNPMTSQSITIASPIELPVPFSVELPPAKTPAPDTGNSANGSTTISPENKTPLTATQIQAQTIRDTLYNNGDISEATATILQDFGIAPDNKSQPISNHDFTTSIETLATSYKALITASGHADSNYVNNALLDIAELQAIAKDPSVLQSKDLLSLLDQIKAPTDAYQARLFAQYLATAHTTLSANSSVLLTGIDIETFQAKIETWYAYALMADTSDTDQSNKIQAMKDADAAAAAIAAADAAAKIAAKSSEQPGSTQSPESEAIANLINRETDSVKKTMFIVFQFFMNHGYPAPQDGAIVGSLSKESGSTMNPSKPQDGGPAYGIAQWEGGRLMALRDFAASQNLPWDNLDVQLRFIDLELHTTRGYALGPLMAAQNLEDASYAFTKNFETPDIMIHGTQAKKNIEAHDRAMRGEVIFDAFNSEVAAVKNARATALVAQQAAAADAATVEKKRYAEHGMNLAQATKFMSDYMTNPDNIKYIGGSGTTCPNGPLANCTSFTSYFLNKYFEGIKHMGPGNGGSGNGNTFVETVVSRNRGIATGNTPKINAVFSVAEGSTACKGGKLCGHTAVILGIDEAAGTIIVGEAGCSANLSWDTAHVRKISDYSGEGITYFYTDGLGTRDLIDK